MQLNVRNQIFPRGYRVVLVWLCMVAIVTPNAVRGDDPPADLSQYYGFQPLEIFKLSQRSANLIHGDFSGDGLTDLMLIDNSHSRIDLLVQRTKEEQEKVEKKASGKVNEFGSDLRFDHQKLPVNKELSTMTKGDFNGDGKLDIAYFGIPDQLVVRYQSEKGDWTKQQTWRIPGVLPVQWTIAGGDLNGDSRDDLVILGKDQTTFFYQLKTGKFDTPVVMMNTSDKLGLAQTADLNGDGRHDLTYLAEDGQDRYLCARIQTSAGYLGAEIRFDLHRPRSITLAEIDDKPGYEVLSIDSVTGRLTVSALQSQKMADGELPVRLVQYGFGSQGGRDRDLATGDVDGDGLTDVIVTAPDIAQIMVFRQLPDLGLDLGTSYPGLMGVNQVRFVAGTVKKPTVFILSPKEQIVGISRFEGGRLTFPTPLEIGNNPLAMDVADLNGDGSEELVVITAEESAKKYRLVTLRQNEEGAWIPLGDQEALSIELSSKPTSLLRLDANLDGKHDFLVFFSGDRAPDLLLGQMDGGFRAMKMGTGIGLGEVTPGTLFTVPQINASVLSAQKNFARHLRLDDKNQWQVVDQYNAQESNAQISGVAMLDLDGQPGDEIAMIDTGVRRIRILKKGESVFEPWKEVELGNFPFRSTRVADLNADQRPDLLLFGQERFAVLHSSRTDYQLVDLATFETKLLDTYFVDVTAGDLNADKVIDLTLLDTRSQMVEMLRFDGKQLQHVLQFKVFEAKNFSGGEGELGIEPREAAIVDVTGDGLKDLILLTHDRLLLYPQDAPPLSE
ncbi:MAG: FG-GAP and VCBS repeat-containing protein [Planctomycetaceae bacterium]